MLETRWEDLRRRITMDPAVLAGKPVIRGMRISVEQILRTLSFRCVALAAAWRHQE